jgi:co-chaperonin GroES (HSP10)
MDAAKVKPMGPWILVKVSKMSDTLKSGLYVPDGNAMDRLGHAEGVVLEVGQGLLNTSKNAKTKYTPHDLSPGDRVVFRGHLQNANKVNQLDDEHCLLHVTDIVGVLGEGETLDRCLPYDN